MFKYIILLLLGLNSSGLYAENLLQIYALGLQNDAALQIARAEYQAEIESLPIASSFRKPQIDFAVTGVYSETDQSIIGRNSNGAYGYSVGLFQNLYNAEILATVGVAEANVARASAVFEVSQQDLIVRVAVRYFAILAAQDNVDFTSAEQTAIARQLEEAQKRFEVGLIAITDVKEAQAQFDRAIAQSLLAQNLLNNTYQALLVIISEPPEDPLALLGDDLVLNIPEPASIQQWVDISLQNNQNLIAALAAQRAADQVRIGRRKANYPTVDLTASYAQNSVEDGLLANYDLDDLRLKVQLEMPIFTGGRITAERQQAEASYRSAQSGALLQTRLTSQETSNAYLDLVSGISQVKAFEQALISSQTALKATEAGFSVGTRTSIDVLLSLRETYRSERDYAGSRYEYLLNLLRLKQAAGLLTVDDLKQINAWLL
jgi:outer membrane protein